MVLFRKVSLYFAIFGIVTLFALLKTINKPAEASVPIEQPSVNPYRAALAASGIIEALDRNLSIGAPMPGLILSVSVNVGDQVKKGDPLFQLDDRDLQAQLLVQKANLAVSAASLQKLEDQLRRLESVTDPRAVSQEDIQTRKNDVEIAKAQLGVAENQIQHTQLLIDRTIVRAPRNGVILQNNIRGGEYLSTNGTTPAMLLGNTERLQIRVDIDEQNASRFREHLSAIAYPKNDSSRSFNLTFDHIEPYILPKKSLTGTSSERVDTRVLQVIYTFEQPKELNIYVGQQVDIYIQEENK